VAAGRCESDEPPHSKGQPRTRPPVRPSAARPYESGSLPAAGRLRGRTPKAAHRGGGEVPPRQSHRSRVRLGRALLAPTKATASPLDCGRAACLSRQATAFACEVCEASSYQNEPKAAARLRRQASRPHSKGRTPRRRRGVSTTRRPKRRPARPSAARPHRGQTPTRPCGVHATKHSTSRSPWRGSAPTDALRRPGSLCYWRQTVEGMQDTA
jgi:hypothetical protein